MGADSVNISLERVAQYIVYGLRIHFPCDYGDDTLDRHISACGTQGGEIRGGWETDAIRVITYHTSLWLIILYGTT